MHSNAFLFYALVPLLFLRQMTTEFGAVLMRQGVHLGRLDVMSDTCKTKYSPLVSW